MAGSRTQDPNHPRVFGARVVIAHQQTSDVS
jgi:hypothetical protein